MNKKETAIGEERIFITPKQAINLVIGKDEVHCTVQAAFGFIGADHSMESVIKTFKDADKIEIGGENCERMGHAIVVFPKDAKMQSDLMFFAHDPEKLKKFNEQ